MRKQDYYDFYLILATTLVLFLISIICLYGMFHFKEAQIDTMPKAVKIGHMNDMNVIISPFLIGLILLLGICVPKRLLPAWALNGFALFLFMLSVLVTLAWDVTTSLLSIVAISSVLQVVVVIMAAAGSKRLHFERQGYWLRLGSSFIHLGLLLFILDLHFYRARMIHLLLFWTTTGATMAGLLFCFYSGAMVRLVRGKPRREPLNEGDGTVGG